MGRVDKMSKLEIGARQRYRSGKSGNVRYLKTPTAGTWVVFCPHTISDLPIIIAPRFPALAGLRGGETKNSRLCMTGRMPV